MAAWLTVLMLLILVCILFLGFSLLDRQPKSVSSKIEAQPLITAHEQKMFFQLVEAFPSPDYFIFAQVAFSALLCARSIEVRSKFNRKRTDFVVTDHALQVLAIIELDDWSHEGREEEDAARDRMLTDAGYRVVRFPKIPAQRELIGLRKTL